jgi:hypothetical protein
MASRSNTTKCSKMKGGQPSHATAYVIPTGIVSAAAYPVACDCVFRVRPTTGMYRSYLGHSGRSRRIASSCSTAAFAATRRQRSWFILREARKTKGAAGTRCRLSDGRAAILGRMRLEDVNCWAVGPSPFRCRAAILFTKGRRPHPSRRGPSRRATFSSLASDLTASGRNSVFLASGGAQEAKCSSKSGSFCWRCGSLA